MAWLVAGRVGQELRLPTVPVLAMVQIIAFVGQEVVEQLAAGGAVADVVVTPAVRWGVLAQVLVAAGLVWLTHGARRVVKTIGSILHRVVAAQPEPALPGNVNPSAKTVTALSSLSRRGPPFVPGIANR